MQRMVPVRHRDGMLHCPYSIVCHLLNAFGTMSPALSVANGCDLVEDIYRLERLVVATLGHLLHIEVFHALISIYVLFIVRFVFSMNTRKVGLLHWSYSIASNSWREMCFRYVSRFQPLNTTS